MLLQSGVPSHPSPPFANPSEEGGLGWVGVGDWRKVPLLESIGGKGGGVLFLLFRFCFCFFCFVFVLLLDCFWSCSFFRISSIVVVVFFLCFCLVLFVLFVSVGVFLCFLVVFVVLLLFFFVCWSGLGVVLVLLFWFVLCLCLRFVSMCLFLSVSHENHCFTSNSSVLG